MLAPKVKKALEGVVGAAEVVCLYVLTVKVSAKVSGLEAAGAGMDMPHKTSSVHKR